MTCSCLARCSGGLLCPSAEVLARIPDGQPAWVPDTSFSDSCDGVRVPSCGYQFWFKRLTWCKPSLLMNSRFS